MTRRLGFLCFGGEESGAWPARRCSASVLVELWTCGFYFLDYRLMLLNRTTETTCSRSNRFNRPARSGSQIIGFYILGFFFLVYIGAEAQIQKEKKTKKPNNKRKIRPNTAGHGDTPEVITQNGKHLRRRVVLKMESRAKTQTYTSKRIRRPVSFPEDVVEGYSPCLVSPFTDFMNVRVGMDVKVSVIVDELDCRFRIAFHYDSF
ncbi:hypothetical protein PIB30_038736 [Stylosanthes scabra]|uniref:Uncharacterized protein n=1 Tax=Stylosanthes scabra TaxID=79078 RepID=A0ABU6TF54_9FABA|nr:hypothetical protein [Stylosanthes scabra]